VFKSLHLYLRRWSCRDGKLACLNYLALWLLIALNCIYMLFLLNNFVVNCLAFSEIVQSELNFFPFVSAYCGVKLGFITYLRCSRLSSQTGAYWWSWSCKKLFTWDTIDAYEWLQNSPRFSSLSRLYHVKVPILRMGYTCAANFGCCADIQSRKSIFVWILSQLRVKSSMSVLFALQRLI